jgi:hypothetical protein
LNSKETLLGHPIVGSSWEGFVIENLLAVAPEGTEASFYRTSAGAEIDLVLKLPGNRLWAIEIKRGLNPKPGKGFHNACADLKPDARYLVYSGRERFPVTADIVAISLAGLAQRLCQAC